ncbi:MAG: polysaccharide deacetylase family protein [Deltaproteobacteria bacterium]|nr:polysaccharide deacetylase family protein [Deltaproteobacteria bacterium]
MGMKMLAKRLLAAGLYSLQVPQRKLSQPGTWRILMYHRVIEPEQSLYPLEEGIYTTPESFARQMTWLKKHCQILSLAELVEELSKGNSNLTKAVAITFDDGWDDTCSNAYPILRDLNIPATVFLATDYIGTDKLFWTDKVAIAVAAIEDGFLLTEAQDLLITENKQYDQLLLEIFYTLASGDTGVSTQTVIEYILRTFKGYNREQLKTVMEVIDKCFGKFIAQTPRQFLSWAEVQEMSQRGISFASHSHSHENLTGCLEDFLRNDLTVTADCFKNHKVKTLPVFCYPGGYYNDQTQAVLSACGYQAALKVGCQSDLTANPMLLGRIGIHDDISSSDSMFACRISLDFFSG